MEGRDSVLCPGGGANALGPRIPIWNNLVVVELHLKSSVNLHRVIVDHYGYLNKTA